MVLPEDAEAFRDGLALYFPQRALAKLVVRALTKLPILRSFLKTGDFELVPASPIEKISKDNEATFLGLLLGNPSQKERRGLLLVKNAAGEKRVAKVGTTTEAREKIVRESHLLVSLKDAEQAFPAIPQIGDIWNEEEWDAFTLSFYEVDPSVVFSRSEAVTILRGWASPEKSEQFRESKSWLDVMAELTEEEQKASAQLPLRSSLRHGDFAPWNILKTLAGDIIVIDWEFGLLDDVPGWDLIHFLILEASLIDRREPRETIEYALELLRNDEQMREFLEFVGWAGYEELLIKTYLLSMGDQLDQFTPFLNGPILTPRAC